MNFNIVVDTDRYPAKTEAFISDCRKRLDEDGVLVLPGFIRPASLHVMKDEAAAKQDRAFFCTQKHTVYLTEQDDNFPPVHAKNRLVESSKGCICDDDIDENSPLRILYDAQEFRAFIMGVTGQSQLHPYADSLSSINIHYAKRGQQLGWHFDNSSFAITLLIDKPDDGSHFEYVKDVRDADAGSMNYEAVDAVLDGKTKPKRLEMDPGSLVLFRGRNSMHRVTPNESDKTRMLAVLAYNSEAGVVLSESARMTFYGRLA